MKVRTLNILPLDSRIVLKEYARNKVFGDKKFVANKLGLSQKTIENWIRADYRPSLKQLNDLGVDTKSHKFFGKIDSIGISKSNKLLFLPESIFVPRIAWLIGIVEGDRAGEREVSVGLTNEDDNLIRKFLEDVRELGVKRSEIKAKIQLTVGEKFNKETFSKEFQIPKENISVSESEIPRKKPVIQVLANRKILAYILSQIRNLILEGKFDSKSVREFIKGFCDAEGSVNLRKRTVEIKQKNIKEGRKIINFISKNLTSIGIKNSINGPNSENMLIIRLAGGKKNANNLKRFYNFIGFESDNKTRKLEEILL